MKRPSRARFGCRHLGYLLTLTSTQSREVIFRSLPIPTIKVRNLPEDVHRRIRLYAAEHGLSAEAAVRRLLDEATRPPERLGDVEVAFARSRQADFPETPRDRPSKV